MTIYAQFEEKYRFSTDPWQTLSADKALYYDWLLRHLQRELRRPGVIRVLDIGCGEGHFTTRLSSGSIEVVGVDISKTAIERARVSYPGLRFECVDFSDRFSHLGLFDLILCSQVLYYLSFAQLMAFFQNAYDHLANDGRIVLAAKCASGGYFEREEFHDICSGNFEPIARDAFGDHELFIGSRRLCRVAVTVDYEVSEHAEELRLEENRWTREVIEPTANLIRACEVAGAKLTIFVEMGQYWFLRQHAPDLAARIDAQLCDAVSRGHDVQVHLHSRWLAEAGARVLPDGSISLGMQAARIHELPRETLRSVLGKAKADLERLLTEVAPTYEAICFRAGKYQIQPHDVIFRLLADLGYRADTSVWHGGFLSAYDGKPGFDFRTLWHPSKVYWPNAADINRAGSSHDSHGIAEIPILARNRIQWSFDDLEAARLVAMFNAHTAGGGTRVMIGHSKNATGRVVDQLQDTLSCLAAAGVRFTTMREAAAEVHCDRRAEREIAALNSYRKRSLLSAKDLWARSSQYHRYKAELIAAEIVAAANKRDAPVNVLDVGCGTGELLTFPLTHVLGDRVQYRLTAIDVDAGSIDRAHERLSLHANPRLTFACKTVEEQDGLYDIVICSEVLEHLASPESLLKSLVQKLSPGGVLILTVPNGYGYKELERRVLMALVAVVKAAPSPIRRALLALRRRVAKRVGSNSSDANEALLGTLNYANDVHVQFFRLSVLKRMLLAEQVRIVAVRNTQVLGGIAGGLIGGRFNVERNPDAVPHWLASGWMILCERQGSLEHRT